MGESLLREGWRSGDCRSCKVRVIVFSQGIYIFAADRGAVRGGRLRLYPLNLMRIMPTKGISIYSYCTPQKCINSYVCKCENNCNCATTGLG